MSLTIGPDVLLIGDGLTSLAALRSLIRSCHVVGVIRRDTSGELDPVRSLAAEAGVPVFPRKGLNDLQQIIVQLQPKIVVISTFDRILPKNILRLSRFISVHYSALPRYRGRASVRWALINGEPTIAMTIHSVSSDFGSGNVLFQQEIAIDSRDTVASLFSRLNAIQERELGRVVIETVAGAAGVPQDHTDATYGCSRNPDDGEIDWARSTVEIDRLIRALTPPFRGAFTHLDGQRLIIFSANPLADPPKYVGRVPGRVIRRSAADGWVDVLTGDGILRVRELISGSGAIASAAEIITSAQATLGLSRLDLLQRIEVLADRITELEGVVSSSLASSARMRLLGSLDFDPDS
jgi:methionyl-tRNA formyltransferase